MIDPTASTIGVMAPGAMGSALGRVWQATGARVVTTVAGRSERTRRLAEGLEWLDSLHEVVSVSDVLVSVVPPARALANAETLADACREAGVRPVVADLNAVSPTLAEQVAGVLAEAGCSPVDGSISGPPPGPGRRTTVYLSGERAAELTPLATEGLAMTVVGDRIGQASAVKMCTAAMYKGITGLLLQSLRTADAHGVVELVLADLAPTLGPIATDAANAIAVAVSKSDRFPDEMLQIAATQAGAGQGDALYRAMAEVYARSNQTGLAGLTPEQAADVDDVEQVLAALRRSR